MADFVAGKGELSSSAVTAASATAGDMTAPSRTPVTEVSIHDLGYELGRLLLRAVWLLLRQQKLVNAGAACNLVVRHRCGERYCPTISRISPIHT